MPSNRHLFLFAIILVAALFRLIGTGLPNVSPVAAIALLGGAYFTNKSWAFIATFAVMLLSDAILGFHDTMWAVYLSFALIVGIGFVVGRNRSPLAITAGSLSGSIVFFVITNFAVWLGSGYYPQTITGLLTSYTMAIPFFHYTLLGDLLFNAVLFSTVSWLTSRYPELAPVKA